MHIAHRILNDQYRIWQRIRQRTAAELQQNMTLLKQQQKQAVYMQMQRMQAQKRGGYRGYGYGGYGFGGGGASPMISYRMMQWAQLQVKIGQEEFQHTEVTVGMLAVGRGQVRAHRHRTAAAVLLVLSLLWVGLWVLSVAAGLVVTALAAAVFLVLAWVQGRRPTRRRPPVPRLLFVPPTAPAHTDMDPEPDPAPFALREAGNNPRQAREAMRLALKKEGARIAEVLPPTQTTYGWRIPVVLDSGTLAQFATKLRPLATTLRVGESRILARPADPEDAALIDVDVLLKDPFADPLPYPDRAPGSCSIRNAVSTGISIEGETTPVVLAGQHVIIVGDTGSGKTAMVQCLAEYVTACADAVVVDIDTYKRGLKALAPAAALTARTDEEAEQVLEHLLERARTRIASMPPTQDMWDPRPDAPAIVVFLDEYPRLSPRAKQLAVDLLRLGREALVSVVIITQDATSDVMGDAIADVPGVRIMLPCRAADTPLVVGRSDAVSQGWLPHLLIPSPDPDNPADAGRFYCITPRHHQPVLRYVTPLDPQEAARRTAERIAAGLPRLEPMMGAAPYTPYMPAPVAPLAPLAPPAADWMARHLGKVIADRDAVD
ncbi:ATP-binding protein, partial [Streptomyces palmae]